MAYCWISSPGLPRGTSRLIYKMDLTIFPLKSGPHVALLTVEFSEGTKSVLLYKPEAWRSATPFLSVVSLVVVV